MMQMPLLKQCENWLQRKQSFENNYCPEVIYCALVPDNLMHQLLPATADPLKS
jgi:hypothetical protein